MAAGQLAKEIGLERRVLNEWGRVDIFAIATELDVPVVFRPLKGLLGVFMRQPTPGVLVTNQRPRSVQRLTCAHEIGHFYLNHAMSMDDESSVGIAMRLGPSTDFMELEADGFAYELLMPRYLVRFWVDTLARDGFDMRDPLGIYQLSLRLGCSYQATVLCLQRMNFLDRPRFDLANTTPVKVLKKRLIPDIELESWHSDVWRLGEGDRNFPIQASVNDVFIVSAPEMSAAGYLNELKDMDSNGFRILRESISRKFSHTNAENGVVANTLVGGAVEWQVAFQTMREGSAHLTIETSQPWEKPTAVKELRSTPMSVLPREPLGLSIEMKQKELGWRLSVGDTNN